MNLKINSVVLTLLMVNLNAMGFKPGVRSKVEEKKLNQNELDFFKAAIKGDDKLLNKLIMGSFFKKGVNINLQTGDGDTALIKSALYDHPIITKELLKIGGIDTNIQNKDGDTALIVAARKCHINVLKELLNARVINFNIKNKKGNTALLEAVAGGCFPVVELLVNAGANINLKNTNNQNGLTLALNARYQEPSEFYFNEEAFYEDLGWYRSNLEISVMYKSAYDSALRDYENNKKRSQERNENVVKIVRLLESKGVDILDSLNEKNLKNLNLRYLSNYKDQNENNILHQIVDSNLDIKTKEAMIKAILKFAENRHLIEEKTNKN